MKYRKITENIPTIVILVLFLVILSASLWMVILYSKLPSSNSQNIISHLSNKSSKDRLDIALISSVLTNLPRYQENSSDMNSQKFDISLLFIQHIAEIIRIERFRTTL